MSLMVVSLAGQATCAMEVQIPPSLRIWQITRVSSAPRASTALKELGSPKIVLLALTTQLREEKAVMTACFAHLAHSKISGASLDAEFAASLLTLLRAKIFASALVKTVHIQLRMPLAVARVATISSTRRRNLRVMSVTSPTASLLSSVTVSLEVSLELGSQMVLVCNLMIASMHAMAHLVRGLRLLVCALVSRPYLSTRSATRHVVKQLLRLLSRAPTKSPYLLVLALLVSR